MSVAHRADDAPVATETVDKPRKRRRRVGPLIPLISLPITWSILGYLVATRGYELKTFVVALGVLTKVSFLWFVLVFITRPLHDLLHNRATAWLLANRRYLGLTFAVWHLIHWPILAAMLHIAGPAEFYRGLRHILVPATVGLVLITLLAITSNNASQRILGKQGWRALHTISIYAIWIWFARIYVFGKLLRTNQHPYIFVYVGILFAAMALRLAMAVRRVLNRKTA
jgi:methionine sulfoxide reductase heme-binding subunit